MATSKTLSPTGVTIQIPAFTDQPDQRVNSNCIDKEADAINALNDQIGMKNTSIKSTSISNTDTITNIDCSSYRYVLVKFSGNDSNYRSFLFPVTNNDVSQEVNIDASSSIYIHLVFRLSFYDKKMYINSIQLGTWGACGLSIIGVE